MAFHDGLIEGYRERGIYITPIVFLNMDAVEYWLLDAHSGKIRSVVFSGLQKHIYGIALLIALFAEAIVSLKMDAENHIRFGVKYAE